MLKKVFHFKYLYLGTALTAFLFVMGYFGINSSSGKDRAWGGFFILLGIASVCITAVDLVKRTAGRIKIKRSPEYPEMEADFKTVRSLLRGHLFLGEHFLFSAYAGKIFRREEVRYLREEIHHPPRGSAYARLNAFVAGGGTVTIASYDLGEQVERDVTLLADEIKCGRDKE